MESCKRREAGICEAQSSATFGIHVQAQIVDFSRSGALPLESTKGVPMCASMRQIP